ncbi:MAG: diaminopimelate epimerase [Acidimicrobiia bacterium]|nr:MAG: diaminopimelate epimerase [Acidimicrobiia bacterium]
MRFVKMQALGNDFVVVEDHVDLDPTLVRAVCDRRLGVGADGVLTVTRSEEGVRMGYWNADGSAAEMCGNGLRCVAVYAAERGLVDRVPFVVATPVGPRQVVEVEEGRATVEVGPTRVVGTATLEGLELTLVDVGNPHAVAFVDDPDRVEVGALGASIGTHRDFPAGSNVEFVTVETPNRLRMRVWERGVGETLSCGSGMVAAAVAAFRSGRAGRSVEVLTPGGPGLVELTEGSSLLSGPAVEVFEGIWPLG